MADSKSILIDTDSMAFVKATDTVRQAEYWAEIAIADKNFYVAGTEGKHFSVFSVLELSKLYYNTTGQNVPEKMKYNTLLKGCLELAKDLIVDSTSEAELKELLGWEVKDGFERPAIEKKVTTKERKTATGIQRPKEGSTTRTVWDLADSIKLSNEDWTRANIIAACVEAGINQSTASTQYAKWNKFTNGI